MSQLPLPAATRTGCIARSAAQATPARRCGRLASYGPTISTPSLIQDVQPTPLIGPEWVCV